MTAPDLVALAGVGVPLAGALVQGALALGRVYMMRERLKAAEDAIAKLQDSRGSQGARIGAVESSADKMSGRLDELSRTVHAAAKGGS